MVALASEVADEVLRMATAGSSREVRTRGVEALDLTRDDHAEALVGAAGDKHWIVRRAAVARLDPARPSHAKALVQAVWDGDWEVSRIAVERLDLSISEHANVLIAVLTDRLWPVGRICSWPGRRAAIERLDPASEEHRALLVRIAGKEKLVELRVAAVNRLDASSPDQARTLHEIASKERRSTVRRAAAERLREHANAGMQEAVVSGAGVDEQKMAEPPSPTRERCVAEASPDELARLVLEAWEWTTRTAALARLEPRAFAGHAEALRRVALEERSWIGRHLAVKRLVPCITEDAEVLARVALEDEHEQVRRLATMRLDVGLDEHAKVLLQVARDDNSELVRIAAVQGLDPRRRAHKALLDWIVEDETQTLQLTMAAIECSTGGLSPAAEAASKRPRREAIDWLAPLPYWMVRRLVESKRPWVRAVTVERLDAARVEHAELLARAVRSDASWRVRRIAVRRLDPLLASHAELLRSVAFGEHTDGDVGFDWRVCQAAERRLWECEGIGGREDAPGVSRAD